MRRRQKSLSILDAAARHARPPIWANCCGASALPFSALLLALLAIPLSFVNPRAGRSLNLILAGAAVHDLQQLHQHCPGLGGAGKLHPALGVWLVHGVLAMLLAVLFYRRLLLAPFCPGSDAGFRGGACMKILHRYLAREIFASTLLVFSPHCSCCSLFST